MPIEKITRFVKVGFTEREFLDMCSMANADERAVGEFIRREMRSLVYGKLSRISASGEWSNSAFDGPGDTGRDA